MTANETDTSQPKIRWRLLIGLGAAATIIITIICVIFYQFVIRGTSGEPADRDTVQAITVEFVSALQDGDYPAAKGMFSDKNREEITIETLETLANESAIAAYQSLNVCDFKVFYAESSKHLAGMGIIQYEGGRMAFESMLLQNADETWEMYGFFLKPDEDTAPWGACY